MTCDNTAHRGDPQDYCAACARDCEAELTLLGDRYQRLLNEQSAESRRTQAAARRDAQDHMRAFARLFFSQLMDDPAVTADVRAVLYRASQVSGEWARAKNERYLLDTLAGYARVALRTWDEHASRDKAAAAFAADPREAEITRLRAVIETAGKRLHDTWQPILGETPCSCAGCELIRDMDDVDAS